MARVLELIENVLAQLESADWAAAAVALAVHLANVAARAHAWRNIIAAAYPADRVGRRRIFSFHGAHSCDPVPSDPTMGFGSCGSARFSPEEN